MDRYPKELANRLPDGCVKTNMRVCDVEKTSDGYCISALQRDGNKYTEKEFSASQVVLAAPPVALRNLKVAKDMLPALSAVTERRLGHVYCKCKPGTANVPDNSQGPDRIYRKLPDSILQQVISGDYGQGVFQAAYACGRFERVWRELQYQGPDVVMEHVKEQLNKISDLKSPPDGWDEIDEVFVRIGFVHKWRIEAHVSGKTKEELSMQAMTPNPCRLPGLFLAGEAFSPEQAWTEGALWTGEKVADMLAKARKSNGEYDYSSGVLGDHAKTIKLGLGAEQKLSGLGDSDRMMVYKGLVLDVSDWSKRHPGGKGPINGHSGEDVSNIFDNFHPGWPAPLATAFGLQVGCADL